MRAALVLLLGLAACAPSGQLLLYVDTDAVVPTSGTGALDPLRPHWLFDTLRVEVAGPDRPADATSTRDFPLDEAQLLAGLVSVGIAPPLDVSGFTARVRLFRGDFVSDGEPQVGATLDSTYALPSVGRYETTVLNVVLHVDDIGTPLGVPDALVPARGKPGPSVVGTWAGAQRVSCPSAPGDDEVCIPGGAFWIGDTHPVILATGLFTAPQRLAVMSPFFLDATEVTVAAFRTKWATLGGMYRPSYRLEPADPTKLATWCTWSAAPGDVEALPIDCLVPDTAQLYCRAVGRSLPSEAQYAYVATGLGLQDAYVWGNDEPVCGDAAWGLGGGGGLDSANPGDGTCRGSAELGMPFPPGQGVRDRRVVRDAQTGAEGTVLDLAGNMAEMTLDDWSLYDAGPYLVPGVLHDPVYVATPQTTSYVARGGDWRNGAYTLLSVTRGQSPRARASDGIGFRCARMP